MAEVLLRAGGLEAGLEPSVGGAVTHFTLLDGGDAVDLLRRAPDGASNVLQMACFPLVPFCNRVRDGRFSFRGREVTLEPNLPPHPHPLHGQGWRNPWTVEAVEAARTELVFLHEPGEWPWAYEARLGVAIAGGALAFDLSCRNLADEPMPCGLGLHPYYPCDEATVLDAQVATVWTVDEDVMPVEALAAEGRYGLAGRLICAQDLDNGYDGWSGAARILWPDRRLGLELTSDARRLQVFAPPHGGSFAAEPASHANGALNRPESEWPALGMRVLEPGEAARLSMRLRLLRSPSA
jgi:aldose 1-epimerase